MKYEKKLLTIGESHDLDYYDPIIIVIYDALNGEFLVERYFDDLGMILDSERRNPVRTYVCKTVDAMKDKVSLMEEAYLNIKPEAEIE